MCSMPFLKRPQTTEPRVKLWDRKAQKCGLHHTVYSVNGDQYTGDWMDNNKHGNTVLKGIVPPQNKILS